MGLCKHCGKEYSSKVLKIHQKICKEQEGIEEVKVEEGIEEVKEQEDIEEVKEQEDIEEVKVEEDLFNLTNKVLKEMCEERGLPIYGTKKELVERLGD